MGETAKKHATDLDGRIKPQGTAGRSVRICVQHQACFKHCEDPAQLAIFVIALFLPSDSHLVAGEMTGNYDFCVRPGRTPSTPAPKANSFLTQALASEQNAGGFPVCRARTGARLGPRLRNFDPPLVATIARLKLLLTIGLPSVPISISSGTAVRITVSMLSSAGITSRPACARVPAISSRASLA